MTLFPRRKSALSKRLEAIDRELQTLDSDLRYLSKVAEEPEAEIDLSRLKSVRKEEPDTPVPVSVPPPRPVVERPSPVVQPVPQEPEETGPSAVDRASAQDAARNFAQTSESTAKDPSEEETSDDYRNRFADYLASNFEAHAIRPLRHERRVQRNKAVLVVIFLIVIAIIVLYRLIA